MKELPPPLLSKTERDSFPSFRSSVKRLLSSVRHCQHIALPVLLTGSTGGLGLALVMALI
ncbi:MAG: hypothetical protein V7K85_30715 [Nostoc sp.]